MTVPPNHRDLSRGIDLFNRSRFFDAHEELEYVWRSLPRDCPSRRHIQGMVQLAVAFHHESTGNRTGARSLLERAVRNLDGADVSLPELDLARLRIELASWQHYLNHSVNGAYEPDIPRSVPRSVAPGLPKILRHR
jgi:predicted metal-dependent hydrolase